LLGLALELTGSTAIAALVLVLQSAPFFLLSPFAGAVADRLDRRRVMIVADVARVGVCLGFLVARDPSTLWVAFVSVSLLSVGAAFFEPASAAALPNLVDPDDLGDANALLGAAWGTMAAVGAAIGGVVAAVLGRDVAFLGNALSFLLSALLILGVHRPFHDPRRDATSHAEAVPGGLAGARSAVTETLRVARGSRAISAFLLTKATFGAGMGVLVLLAVFGREVFEAGDIGIGVLFAARGIGALVGPFVARRWAGNDDRLVIQAISAAVVVFLASYALLPLAPGLLVAAACVLAAHMGGGVQWMLSGYALQRSLPDRIRGRVLSMDFGLVTAATAASQLLAGWVAASAGPTVALYLMVGIVAVTGGAWLLWTRPLRARAPIDPPRG
jgi:MFS family permease